MHALILNLMLGQGEGVEADWLYRNMALLQDFRMSKKTTLKDLVLQITSQAQRHCSSVSQP